ncbi:AT_hook domain-containing protein [Cephalotus follicularis]|uniref:AT_hook domain-containing protein n=1 Tax=Cephalotus follicularis TaxID=3775 RepID=A0A1Q3CSE1_CEPFO|nr:AT_hook domain-containing protein [Cephalotus follicularis]
MNQQSQDVSSASPADVPMKRKRGRPRKDESLIQGENKPSVPGSDSVKKNKQSLDTSNAVVSMVGQVVSGVIEGSFDAGYLLNVKVGGTDTHLRGVVFLPGKFTPITAANDVAPHAKMYTRKETPIPALNPQSQVHGFVPPSEPSNKQPVELKNNFPKLPDQIQHSKLLAGFQNAGEIQSTYVSIHPADQLAMSETGLSLGGNVPSQQSLEAGPKNQTASVIAQLKHDEFVEQDEVQQEFKASMLVKGPNIDIEETKVSEPLSAAPYVAMGYVAANQESQDEHKASEPKPNELVHDEVKTSILEHNQTSVFAEPVSVSTEPIGINLMVEKEASSKEDSPEHTHLNLGNKILSEDDASRLNGTPAYDATMVTETDSNSAPFTSISVLTFGGEAISSELKIATEGSSLPSMIDPQNL